MVKYSTGGTQPIQQDCPIPTVHFRLLVCQKWGNGQYIKTSRAKKNVDLKEVTTEPLKCLFSQDCRCVLQGFMDGTRIDGARASFLPDPILPLVSIDSVHTFTYWYTVHTHSTLALVLPHTSSHKKEHASRHTCVCPWWPHCRPKRHTLNEHKHERPSDMLRTVFCMTDVCYMGCIMLIACCV